ncbi:MAG TPA: serine--tRNA ligase [Anaerolineae bacterium]|nr:serine--tRNA ligase [Ardenticatenia bacterium]HQZ69903.1 serine--tRNA ligase [Anaerolineae bacterium]HRA20771.1 serine--tRNA ligase [Anaerolineae bacterium]
MLDIKLFRDEPDKIREALRHRGEETSSVDAVRALDAERRAGLTELEALRAERNTVSKAIGQTKDQAERARSIEDMQRVKARIDALEVTVDSAEKELQARLQQVPNVPHVDVPVGPDESGNVVLRQVGQKPELGFAPQAHWDLGPSRGLIDFDRGTRISGSRFYVLNGGAARLQRALIQFMLDFHTERGYHEVYTPFVVREQCMWNAGQLPKFKDNLYHDHEDDLWLVPTAEVPLTNLYAGEILAAEQLPIHHVAYTPCFRREKMSAGRDVRGIKRGHQFDKVEMFKFTRPEDSPAALAAMLADGEALLQALDLPYRVLQLCTGDLGFGSMITYDLEVWAAGCDEWLEVSSISDFGSFQARRAGIRYRREPGAPTEFVHTLNGSGLGLPRTMIAIMENNQEADGSIRVPEVLRDRVKADRI